MDARVQVSADGEEYAGTFDTDEVDPQDPLDVVGRALAADDRVALDGSLANVEIAVEGGETYSHTLRL